mmetsp:Transcript_88466/g.249332  ORF Transcript_88466/g.249332 Transcript_88466/m.249332 type:complete len:278 (-) Transcript_88466:2114-2947(-)
MAAIRLLLAAVSNARAARVRRGCAVRRLGRGRRWGGPLLAIGLLLLLAGVGLLFVILILDHPELVDVQDDTLESLLYSSDAAFVHRDTCALAEVVQLVTSNVNIAHLETNVGQQLRQQVLPRYFQLGRLVETFRVDQGESVLQHVVQTGLVIERKNKQGTTQVQGDSLEVPVHESPVLRVVGEMGQHTDDFLPPWRPAHLVELVEEDDWVHALRLHDQTCYPPPSAAHVRVGVALQHRRVRRPPEVDLHEGPLEGLRDALAAERGLAVARRALDSEY